MTKNPEQGSASLRIELREGVISVYHGQTGTLLEQVKAVEGQWNDLYEAIKNSMNPF